MRFSVTVAMAIALAACDRSSEPEQSAGVRSPATAAATPAVSLGNPVGVPQNPPAGLRAERTDSSHAGADLDFVAPAGWTRSEKAMPMRKATYTVPHAAGDTEDADLSISQAGGTVAQNVARWAGQFGVKPEDVKQSTKTVAGLKVTTVEIHGDYAGMSAGMSVGGPAGAKKSGWGLLGAIIETSPPHFLKLTGPDKTLAAAKVDFDRFVDSAKAK